MFVGYVISPFFTKNEPELCAILWPILLFWALGKFLEFLRIKVKNSINKSKETRLDQKQESEDYRKMHCVSCGNFINNKY